MSRCTNLKTRTWRSRSRGSRSFAVLAIVGLALLGAGSVPAAPFADPLPGGPPNLSVPPAQNLPPLPISPFDGPQTQVLDDFNRGDEDPLYQNGQWALNDPRGGCCVDTLEVNFTQAAVDNAGNNISYRVQNYAADFEVYASIPFKPGVGNAIALVFNVKDEGTGNGWDGYFLTWDDQGATDTLRIEKIINNSLPGPDLARTFVEMNPGDKILARRIGSRIEGWVWQLGTWSLKVVANDSTLMGGKIGALMRNTAARFDDFGGGGAITLLDQYAPELPYDSVEGYRADSAAEITDSYVPGDHTNELLDAQNNVLAAADPDVTSQAWPTKLSLGYLAAYTGATTTDKLNEAGSYQADADRLHAMPQYGNKMYGRVTTYGTLTVIQYWFFLYYNPKTFAFVGNHEGDWESITVLLNSDGTRVGAAYSQHDYGEVCAWQTIEKTADGRPIVYVGEGSHASYFHASPPLGHVVYYEGLPAGTVMWMVWAEQTHRL